MNNNVNQDVDNSTNNQPVNNASQIDNQCQVNNNNQQMNNNQNFNNQQTTNQTSNVNSEVESGKVMAVLSYIGILVLIPYFSEKNNSFVVFHAKQGLNLLILEIIAIVAASILGRILYMYYILTSVVEIAAFVLSIIGIVYAVQGEKKEIPVVSQIKIVK